MDELENKLSAIMGNPEMMEKIMALANSMGSAEPNQKADTPQPSSVPQIDLSMLQKLSGMAGHSNIDSNQKNLLKALGPYLSRQRLGKLERAMRAAKMAGLATTILPNLGLGR